MKKTKVFTSITAVILAAVLLFVTIVTINNNTKVANAETAEASVRTVELSQDTIDAQSILDEFDNATLTTEGTTTYFEGFKPLDKSTLSEIDYISDIDFEQLEECIVKYNFSYDTESNIVTIAAQATLPNGTVEIDEISGVGFINDSNEIDAVMNIDGEGVLLSEMRNAGLIENCGWFSNLVKTVAKTVAVVAVAAVAVAAVVVTAGTAAVAVVGTSVAISATVAAASTIATYATITAAIAAGVALTTELWEKFYPTASITVKNGKSIAQTYDDAKDAIKDITERNKKEKDPAIYFQCEANTNRPYNIVLNDPKTLTEMASLMQYNGDSSITFDEIDAYNVIRYAVPAIYPIFIDMPASGYLHYHALDVLNPNYVKARGNDNPRYRVNGHTIHSFWCAV